MPETPLVSVVIPAYNRAGLIEACLESVRRQSYVTWECLVIDDGSRDDTAARVEALAAADGRIRLLRHESNRGAQAARNTGVRASRGEWVAFLDSDDEWLPGSLEVRLSFAARLGVSVVHSECERVDADGTRRLMGVPAMAGEAYAELLAHPGPMYQGLLVTRDALLAIGELDERLVAYQEWDTAIRLAKRHAFGFVPEPTFVYDCRAGDTISGDRVRAAVGYEQVFRKHRSAMEQALGRRALAQHYPVLALHNWHAGRFGHALGYAARTLPWLALGRPGSPRAAA